MSKRPRSVSEPKKQEADVVNLWPKVMHSTPLPARIRPTPVVTIKTQPTGGNPPEMCGSGSQQQSSSTNVEDIIHESYNQVYNGIRLSAPTLEMLSLLEEITDILNDISLRSQLVETVALLTKINEDLGVVASEFSQKMDVDETTSAAVTPKDDPMEKTIRKVTHSCQEVNKIVVRLDAIKKAKVLLLKQKKLFTNYVDQTQKNLAELPNLITSFVLQTVNFYAGDERKADVCDNLPLNALQATIIQWIHANKSSHPSTIHVVRQEEPFNMANSGTSTTTTTTTTTTGTAAEDDDLDVQLEFSSSGEAPDDWDEEEDD